MDENINDYFVVDASFVLSFLLEEKNIEIESLFKKHVFEQIGFVAPTLLKYEVGNGLKSKVLRKKINIKKAERLFQLYLKISIEEKILDYFSVLNLAIEKNLSFYDASYLYLAKSNKLKLLTLDKDLQKFCEE